jgi:hypothetical protein
VGLIFGGILLACGADEFEDGAPGISTSSEALCPPGGCNTAVFSDNFSGGLTAWTETGDGDWNTEALHTGTGYPAGASGAPAAHSDDCDTACTISHANIDLSGAGAARVTFLRFADSELDAGEYLRFQACAGATCTTLAEWTNGAGDDNAWHTESIDVSNYVGAANFGINFSTRSTLNTEHVHVDDVAVLIEPLAVCGDAVCASSETCSSCAADCGTCSGPVTLFTDNFSAGLIFWTESGDGDWNTEALHSNSGYSGSGAPAAHADDCDVLCTIESPAVDLSGVSSAALVFSRFVDSELDAGEFLRVEAFNGTSWAVLANWTQGAGDSNVWSTEGFDLANYAGVANFRVRFVTKSSLTSEHVQVDDVAVIGNPDVIPGPDSDGDRLPDSAETNTGVFVSATNTGTDPNDSDTDNDSVGDGDETLGTVSGIDLPAMGANPLRRNIFLEYDWFDDANECAAHSHRPTAAAITSVTNAFAGAPVNNPDGSTGITLINDYGQGGAFTGGNFVADADGVLTGGVSNAEFFAHKAANFAASRSEIFHYVLLPHRYGTNSSSSGQAEINGDDLIVSLYCAGSNNNVAHTIMHELGHNLGLRHGGFENTNYKPNYNSVMNYRYQFPGIDNDCTPPGNGVLSYSVGSRITLNESSLVEANGICGPGTVAVDWNNNAVIDGSPVSADINNADGLFSTLQDYNDWGNVIFTGVGDSDGSSAFRVAHQEVEDCMNPAPGF